MNVVSTGSEFWGFSVRTYRRTGVAEACLWLQDRHGLDVNFLLFLIWTGLSRGRLEGERFEAALEFSQRWSENVVGRLRAARRWLKTGSAELPAPARAPCRSLRDEIAERELRAEKLQQEVMERMVRDLPAAEDDLSAARVRARANVERYLARLSIAADEAIESRISVILDSAQGRAERDRRG